MMTVNICILELLLLSGAVDMMVTNLWSFIPSYNNCSHVSLMLSLTLVAQNFYHTNRVVRASSLSECSVEIGIRLLRAFW